MGSLISISTKGLTLVELLMSLIIVTIVMASIYNVLQHSLQAYSHVETQAEVTQNGRMAMERFSKEIRQVAGLSGSFSICDVSNIQFGIDFNANGVITDDGERIQYILSAGKLQRRDRAAGTGAWRPYSVIADYVTGFTLSYRRDNNNILSPLPLSAANRNLVRLVHADLSLQTRRRGAKGKEIYTIDLRTTIHPRNRG